MWKTKVCDILGIEYPIIEGGMHAAGNAELAAAVSNAGGLGMLSFDTGFVSKEEEPRALRRDIRKVESLTDKPFGINFPVFGMGRGRELIETAIEEGVPVAASSGGHPATYAKLFKDAGMKMVCVVGNSKQARAAEAAGADIIVAEGYEAGGRNCVDEITTFVLVPQVVAAVKVPVVAAGGICDSRGFIAALALGAEGVQLGTAFITTHECHVHPNYKQAIINAIDTDTVIVQRSLWQRMRCLKNEFARKWLELDSSGLPPEELQKHISRDSGFKGQFLGDTVNGDMLAGQCAGMITEIVSAGDVVRRIIEGAEAILARCNHLKEH